VKRAPRRIVDCGSVDRQLSPDKSDKAEFEGCAVQCSTVQYHHPHEASFPPYRPRGTRDGIGRQSNC
jgi:hypothetical protein